MKRFFSNAAYVAIALGTLFVAALVSLGIALVQPRRSLAFLVDMGEEVSRSLLRLL